MKIAVDQRFKHVVTFPKIPDWELIDMKIVPNQKFTPEF